MLHTKFRRIGPIVLEEIFKVILTYIGCALLFAESDY